MERTRSLSLMRAVNIRHISKSLSLFFFSFFLIAVCMSHLFKFFLSFFFFFSLPSFLTIQEIVWPLRLHRWRSAVPFSGGYVYYTPIRAYTHTHGIHTFGEKKREEEEEESRVWSARRVINERRIPADKEEPPECSGPPDLTAQPARSFAGGSLRVAYTSLSFFSFFIPPMAYQSDCLWWSYRYIKIVFLFFYFTYKLVGEMLPIDTTTSRYYYFILNIPYQQDRLYGTICRQILERYSRESIYMTCWIHYTATWGGRVLGVRQPPICIANEGFKVIQSE